MQGHIRLDGRDYTLADLGLYGMGTANQMAHAVGQGQTEYKDLTSWSAWIMENWQGGVGMKDPAGGGFLYAEGVDTRFPNQMILGPWVEYTGRVRSMWQNAPAYHFPWRYEGIWTDTFGFAAPEPAVGNHAGMWLWAGVAADSLALVRSFALSGDAPTGTGSPEGGLTAWRQDIRYGPRRLPFTGVLGGDRLVAVTSTGSSVVALDLLCVPARRPAYLDIDGSGWELWRAAWGLGKWTPALALKEWASDRGGRAFGFDGHRAMAVRGAGDGTTEVWLSEDNGTTWTMVNTGAFNDIGDDCDLAAGNGYWIAVGTDGANNIRLRSADNGATWTEIGNGSGPITRPHSICPSGGNLWIAGWRGRVWRTVNNGDNWFEEVELNSGEAATGIVFDGSRWMVAVVGGTANGRLLRGSALGTVWSDITPAALAGAENYRLAGVAHADGVWMLAVIAWPVSGPGTWVMRSTDGGDTWSDLIAVETESDPSGNQTRSLAGSDEVWVVQVGEVALYVSRDRGLTWGELDTRLELDAFGLGWRSLGQTVKSNGQHVWMGLGTLDGPDALSLLVANEQLEPLHLLRSDGIATPDGGQVRLASFDNTMYLLDHGSVYRWDEAAGVWGAAVAIGSDPVTDIEAPAEDELWIAFGSAGDDIEVMDDTEAFATKSLLKADLLHIGAGYLWRSVGSTLYYSADGSTWIGPIEIYPTRYPIRGMADVEGELYVSTDFALYHIAPGDVAVPVTKWGIVDPANGAGMIEYNGSLYIPVGQDLIEFGPTGAVRPMGLNQRDGLPDDRQGRVTALARLNNYLVAGVSAADGCSSLWAWSGEGWHHLAVFPEGMRVADLKFQDVTSNLWVALADGAWMLAARIRLPNDLTNPAKDARNDIRFAPAGWMETDWFYAGVRQNRKDLESVTVFGEGLSGERYAEVYYQVEEGAAWEYLGRADGDTTELIWSDLDTRPDGLRVRLGVMLWTQDGATTPIVNAISLKFHLMLHDWFRWTLPIAISGTPVTKQQLVGGQVNAYTAAQQKAHLMALATRVKPFVFEDLDGTARDVKVVDARFAVVNLVAKPGEGRQLEERCMLTVEAVRAEG